MSSFPPQYPAGPYVAGSHSDSAQQIARIDTLASIPAALNSQVADLSESQWDTRYRNWTVRQIVHHLADSHMNAFLRFRWALTEDRPTIKPYSESHWAELCDTRSAPIATSLEILSGLHFRWDILLRSLGPEQFAKQYFHPESNCWISLAEALDQYVWHGRHHVAQIAWLRADRNW